MGDRGRLSLFGRQPQRHRLFVGHVTAEYRVRTSGRGREVDEWKLRPGAGECSHVWSTVNQLAPVGRTDIGH